MPQGYGCGYREIVASLDMEFGEVRIALSRACRVAQVVEHLLNKCETLGSNSNSI
jgi:hypothetical protein